MGDFMTFFIAIHKDADSSFGVSVPDLPGCVTAGDTIDKALSLAKQAIELHLEGMLEDGVDVPDLSDDIDALRQHPDYTDAIWAAIKVDLNWRPSTSAAT